MAWCRREKIGIRSRTLLVQHPDLSKHLEAGVAKRLWRSARLLLPHPPCHRFVKRHRRPSELELREHALRACGAQLIDYTYLLEQR